jgi:hypothetical protein
MVRLSSMPIRRLKDATPGIMQLHTENLMLVLQSTEEILTWVDALDAATRAEISPDWLARIRTATAPESLDAWLQHHAPDKRSDHRELRLQRPAGCGRDR